MGKNKQFKTTGLRNNDNKKMAVGSVLHILYTNMHTYIPGIYDHIHAYAFIHIHKQR